MGLATDRLPFSAGATIPKMADDTKLPPRVSYGTMLAGKGASDIGGQCSSRSTTAAAHAMRMRMKAVTTTGAVPSFLAFNTTRGSLGPSVDEPQGHNPLRLLTLAALQQVSTRCVGIIIDSLRQIVGQHRPPTSLHGFFSCHRTGSLARAHKSTTASPAARQQRWAESRCRVHSYGC